MIEFDIVDNERFWKVIKKLGPLGKIGAVVFISFDNYVLARAEVIGSGKVVG